MSIPRAHAMPFGAECVAGGVRFRLFAPSVRRVAVLLEGAHGLELPMTASGDGWHELVTDSARPGSPYRFLLDGGRRVPDPASRHQPGGVHGPSEVVDPRTYLWRDTGWRGRPWEEIVLYELHVGAFTPAGTFAAVETRLDELADLGVTAVELMPVADFSGRRNWGYDGVLLFAPSASYGRPEELKHLVEAAHARGLAVFLDVVYNHLGPDGNYLFAYAAELFNHRQPTPWGLGLDFDGPQSSVARDLVCHNALYWLEEFHLDGLRLDAVDTLRDSSQPHILEELAARVRAGPGAERHVHLVLEHDDNAAHLYARDASGRPRHYVAQWNDDVHHALHVALTSETDRQYGDFAGAPVRHLGRALAEGFAYQGEPSQYRGGRPRGEPTTGLWPLAFVNYLQTHDQTGNRGFGERITTLAPAPAVRAATAVVLLSPSPPLVFMGQEWGATQPFLYFCDFPEPLGRAVAEGRRRELASVAALKDERVRAQLPDPRAVSTFERSVLDAAQAVTPAGREWRAFHRELLTLRREVILPLWRGHGFAGAEWLVSDPTGLVVTWRFFGDRELTLLANLGDRRVEVGKKRRGELLYATGHATVATLRRGRLDPWTVALFLREPVASR